MVDVRDYAEKDNKKLTLMICPTPKTNSTDAFCIAFLVLVIIFSELKSKYECGVRVDEYVLHALR